MNKKGIFQRTERLFGKEKMEQLASKRVIIFGIGGVGSWCAESLIRTGIKHLTIVDSDRICTTNINRQLHATTKTVGQVKVDVLKERLLEINPDTEITAIQKIYNRANHASFELETYDFIIDAIDSLGPKMELIRKATRTNACFFSSMGAALKIDPTRIQVGEFWSVNGCPLASIIRKKIKKGDLPAKEFLCVYSDEVLDNKGDQMHCSHEMDNCPKNEIIGDPELADHEWTDYKASVNGTTAHIVAIFGFTLAGLVIKAIYNEPLQ
jgi:tRNA A37 threonylcarbamoyladenosine dehydratase